jgi:hypothetical protein
MRCGRPYAARRRPLRRKSVNVCVEHDELTLRGRQDHLSALAYSVTDAAVDVLIRYIEAQQRGERLTPADPAVDGFLDRLLDLDRCWRSWVRDTGRGADAIVRDACEFWGGALVAAYVEKSLEKMREAANRVIAERMAAIDAAAPAAE